jgi:polyhydroxyalkanoate synthesis regulator phasin
MTDIDACIDRIKNTTNTIVELLADMEEIRDKEMKEMAKRISRLEHELARIGSREDK